MTTYNTEADYYSHEGAPQAVKLFTELHGRKHDVSVAMSLTQLRKRLDKLPQDTKMKAALADLWLGLSQRVGRDRRKTKPPTSPFAKEGVSYKATKQAILEWEAAWRLKKIANTSAFELHQSGASEVQNSAVMLRAKLLWLVEHGDILGWIQELPVEGFDAASVPDLTVQAWTLNDALHQPWRDPREQSLWVKRFAAGNRLLEAEVQRLALAAQAVRTDGVDHRTDPSRSANRC